MNAAPIAISGVFHFAGFMGMRFFAGAARTLEGRAAGEYMSGYTSMIRREAVGVIGQITPWNYPLMMAVWKIGPALAAGNTIVLKPAETTPMTTSSSPSCAAEILPPGVLNIVTGHGDPDRPGADHPPRGATWSSLTGSVETGKLDRAHRRRHAQASAPGARRQGPGHRVRRRRAWRARWRRSPAPGYYNAGQDCTAATRVLAGAQASTTTSSRDWSEQAKGLVIGDTLLARHDARAA